MAEPTLGEPLGDRKLQAPAPPKFNERLPVSAKGRMSGARDLCLEPASWAHPPTQLVSKAQFPSV